MRVLTELVMASIAGPKERRADIVRARRAGQTFRAIAEERGISRSRVAALYARGLRDECDAPPSGPVTQTSNGAELPISRRARDSVTTLGLNLGQLLALPATDLRVSILRQPSGSKRVVNEVEAYLLASLVEMRR